MNSSDGGAWYVAEADVATDVGAGALMMSRLHKIAFALLSYATATGLPHVALAAAESTAR